MDVQLKRGVIENCVLSAMLKGETYGYELIKTVSPMIEISESTLYPILRRLCANGYASVRSAEHNGRLRKYYSITKAGKAKLDDFLKDWKDVVKIYDFILKEYTQ